MEKTAKLVKDSLPRFRGRAALYKLSTPVSYDYDWETEKYDKQTNHVVVSTVNAFGFGIETYIFPSNEDGEIVDWSELEGSQRGTSSHATVLNSAGYNLI